MDQLHPHFEATIPELVEGRQTEARHRTGNACITSQLSDWLSHSRMRGVNLIKALSCSGWVLKETVRKTGTKIGLTSFLFTNYPFVSVKSFRWFRPRYRNHGRPQRGLPCGYIIAAGQQLHANGIKRRQASRPRSCQKIKINQMYLPVFWFCWLICQWYNQHSALRFKIKSEG